MAISKKTVSKKEAAKKDNTANRQRALDNALAILEKQYGKGAVMRLGDDASKFDVEVMPTGCFELDEALGIGGLPRGRIIEVFGPESSGKTTVALQIIAAAQKEGGMAAFVDAEHALDPTYAKALGVNTENIFISQPNTGEEGLEVAEKLISSGALDIVVIDSVAALVPKAEIEGLIGDSHVGVQARLMSQALRKLAGAASQSNTVVIFINQLRDKIGVVYGNPETTAGGKALKFYATIRMDIRKGERLMAGDTQIGNKTKIKIVKNKVAPPFRTAEVEIYYGEGISKTSSTLNAAIAYGLITKSGAWFAYNGTNIAQGRENARLYLKDNPDFLEELEQEIYKLTHESDDEEEINTSNPTSEAEDLLDDDLIEDLMDDDID